MGYLESREAVLRYLRERAAGDGFFAFGSFAIPHAECWTCVLPDEIYVTDIYSAHGGGPIIPQSRVIAVPMLSIDATAGTELLFADLLDASREPTGFTKKLGLHVKTSETASFTMTDRVLTISAGGQVFFAADVPDRFGYFLRVSESLSVYIRSEDCPDYTHMVTLKAHHVRHEPPFFALSPPGAKNPGLLEKSTNWTKWLTLDEGHLIGADKVLTRTYTYSAQPDHQRPKIPPQIKGNACVQCGSNKRLLTIEHCTPKWLADQLHAKPVTARILCTPCNTRFKVAFEDPVATIFAEKAVSQPWARQIVGRWAVKTAAMLAYSTYTDVPEAIRNFYQGIDHGTVSVYCRDLSTRTTLGYTFRVAKFAAKFADAFLVSMAFGDTYFIVINSPFQVGPIPLLEQWHPHFSAMQIDHGVPDSTAVRNVYDHILNNHFGVTLTHEEFIQTTARTEQRR